MHTKMLRGLLAVAALFFAFFSCLPQQADASGAPVGYLALTFDDGPSGAATEYLLEGLRQRQVQVTFFLCGYRMEQYPALVSQIAADGHELAIHGSTHAYLHRMAQPDILNELLDTSGLISELSGVSAQLFRPPGGLYSDAVLAAAQEADLAVVLWSVDPHDWRDRSADVVASRVLKQVKSCDIVLLHDLYRSSADAAFRIIDTLTAQGWEFVTVSELAAIEGTPLRAGAIYKPYL